MELDLTTKCRGCLAEESEMHNLFYFLTEDLTLANILCETTSIQIEENEQISHYLCQKCTKVVVDFYNFKVEFAKSQVYFQKELECKEDSSTQSLSNNKSASIPEHIILVDESTDLKDITKELEQIKNGKTLTNVSNTTTNPLCIHTIVGKHTKAEKTSEIFTLETNKQIMPEVGEFTVENELVQLLETMVFCCKNCNKEYLLKDDFLQHMSSEHDKANIDANKFMKKALVKLPLGKIKEEAMDLNFEDCIENKKEDTTKLCKLCNKLVPKANYDSHYDKHKTFICTCGSKFLRKRHLVNHERSIHSEERPFVCQYCNKAYKLKETLTGHIRHHTHPRSEICHICGQRFNDKTVMQTHIKLKHFPTRDFQCNYCGLNFPLKSTLFKHIRRRHTEREKKFSCSMCNMAYFEQFNLNRHIATRHSDDAVKEKCELCGKHFTTKGNLHKHLRIKHKHDNKVTISEGSIMIENTKVLK